MANLLAAADSWFDQGDTEGNQPPPSWNGTAYVVSFGPEQFGIFTDLVYNGNPAAGDTLAGEVAVSWESGAAVFMLVGIYDPVLEYNVTLATYEIENGVPLALNEVLPGGYTGVTLGLYENEAGSNPAQRYGLQVTITPGAPPVPSEPCEELGRVTRAYVSGYQRDRIHRSRLVRGEKRCLVANFNGAIPPARSIVSVTWRTNQGQGIYMQDARIDGREVTVNITAQTGSEAAVKCEVTLDNGEVYNQLFAISVRQSPWFSGEASPPTGPQVLTSTA